MSGKWYADRDLGIVGAVAVQCDVRSGDGDEKTALSSGAGSVRLRVGQGESALSAAALHWFSASRGSWQKEGIALGVCSGVGTME